MATDFIIEEIPEENLPELEFEELASVQYGRSPKPSGEGEDATWLAFNDHTMGYEDTGIRVMGKDGKSAYEIAVEQGFSGTVAEWLASLKGEQGPAGHTPEKGVDYFTEEDVAEIAAAAAEQVDVPTKVSQLQNDAGYLTEHQSLEAYRTAAEQDEIDEGKQDTISDLDDIREGAALGKTALQAVPEEYAKKADIPGKVSQLQNDAGYITGITGEDVADALGYTPANDAMVQEIENLIPEQASTDNPLADKEFVNSSIGTNTANYISKDGAPFESLAELESYTGTLTNNDYAFVVGTDEAGNVVYTRYKWNADNAEWAEEYKLNNSSFTAAQWAAIQSGITGEAVAQIGENAQAIVQLQNGLALKANDADVYHEWALSFDGTTITKDGEAVTFAQISEWVSDKTKFLYILYGNRLFIPQYDDSTMVSFSCAYLDGNTPTVRRIRIMANGTITTATETMYTKAQADAKLTAENIAYTDGQTQTNVGAALTEHKEGIAGLESGKQNVIADLSTIRSGAAKGATAIQPADMTAENLTDTAFGLKQSEINAMVYKPVKRYGIRIKQSEPNPSDRVEYLYDAVGMEPAYMDYASGQFHMGGWGDAWFVKDNFPCMVKFDGTVDYKLNPNDYTLKADGGASDFENVDYAGNAMSALPLIWVKKYTENGYKYKIFCNVKYDDSYVAYPYQRPNGAIADYLYYPMVKGYKDDNGRLRSIGGVKPTSGMNATQEKAAAVACGSRWGLVTWQAWNLIMDLQELVTKSTNRQAKLGRGHDSGGSSADNFLVCGSLKDKGQCYGYNDGSHAVKFLHIENPYGERWERVEGMLFINGAWNVKDTPGEAGYNFTGTGFTALTDVGHPSGEGWVKEFTGNEHGDFPLLVGGSDATYECDYYYQNTGITSVPLVGAACNAGSKVGRYVNVNAAAGSVAWYFGGSPFLQNPS